MSIKVFTGDLTQKIEWARQRKKADLTKEQRLVHQIDLSNLYNIVSHPHIQAHDTHWLTRFALEGGDISIQKIAQNIYNYMLDQRGRRFIHIPVRETGISSLLTSEIAPNIPASFRYFEKLYLEGRKQRFEAYSGRIDYIFRKARCWDIVKQIGEIRRVEEIFNSQILKFLNPSALLVCAAETNYWEAIDLLVYTGGKIDNFSKLESESNPKQTEWINVYSRAYAARITELNRLEHSLNGEPASKQRAEPTNPGSSSSAGYASNSRYALR